MILEEWRELQALGDTIYRKKKVQAASFPIRRRTAEEGYIEGGDDPRRSLLLLLRSKMKELSEEAGSVVGGSTIYRFRVF